MSIFSDFFNWLKCVDIPYCTVRYGIWYHTVKIKLFNYFFKKVHVSKVSTYSNYIWKNYKCCCLWKFSIFFTCSHVFWVELWSTLPQEMFYVECTEVQFNLKICRCAPNIFEIFNRGLNNTSNMYCYVFFKFWFGTKSKYLQYEWDLRPWFTNTQRGDNIDFCVLIIISTTPIQLDRKSVV